MEWIYINNKDNTTRYALGIVGEKPLICFGVNPSTAEPHNLDNTLKSVSRIARTNGYDRWIMFNLYPQRATNPNYMHSECNKTLFKTNIKKIKEILKKYNNPDIWAAWGTLIEKRNYLKQCLIQISSELDGSNCNWITFGKRSKKGHPHHPLYLNTNSTKNKFDIKSYIEQI